MDHQPETRPPEPRPAIGMASLTLMQECQALRDRVAELETQRARALVRADELRDMAREQDAIARNAAERARYVRQHLADMRATLDDWGAVELPPPRSHARHACHLIEHQDHAE